MQTFDIEFDGLDKLCLVFLNRTANLFYACRQVFIRGYGSTRMQRTFGRIKSELNLENTRNISFAFLAVPSRSRSLAII